MTQITVRPKVANYAGTCLRYYNEVADDAACPCGCVVPINQIRPHL